MSGMRRTIRRSVARRNGLLAPVKKGNANRNSRQLTFKEMMLQHFRALKAKVTKNESEA